MLEASCLHIRPSCQGSSCLGWITTEPNRVGRVIKDRVSQGPNCNGSNCSEVNCQEPTSGRIFVLHVPGLSELEGIEFSSLTGKLSPETFDNVSET